MGRFEVHLAILQNVTALSDLECTLVNGNLIKMVAKALFYAFILTNSAEFYPLNQLFVSGGGDGVGVKVTISTSSASTHND